ncbi:uncharacterized protein E6C27_scaffold409G001090 [Cucumis melo var. makuwa]|uniref:Uncharacterized protein n=1 Tax=Cucumis melo var. makuwa TaxID=1194695 RepID=A0A5A7UY37_CUCMM|nr:uncharacterized protein E6C27_scaffold409G001090 [Cucumis melo var. makuwa]
MSYFHQKFHDNDLLVVVDSVSAGAAGNTSYLNSEVPKSQHSHHDTEIIDIDAFESLYAGISIKAPCCPSDIINYMKIHHEVNVSYNKAWRGCEIALNSIVGTYTAKEADNEGRFRYYFMALAASIDV